MKGKSTYYLLAGEEWLEIVNPNAKRKNAICQFE